MTELTINKKVLKGVSSTELNNALEKIYENHWHVSPFVTPIHNEDEIGDEGLLEVTGYIIHYEYPIDLIRLGCEIERLRK